MTAMANPLRFPQNTHVAHVRTTSDGTHETELSFHESGPFELPTNLEHQIVEARRMISEEDQIYQANPQAYGELMGDFPMHELEGDCPMHDIEDDAPRKILPISTTLLRTWLTLHSHL